MKIKSVLLALAVSTASVFSQGLLSFQNGTFQRFYTSENGLNRVQMGTTANAYTFYIQWGTTAGNLNNSTIATPVYNSTTQTGMLAGNTSFAISGAAGGSTIFIQMFGFESSFGSYANAAATGGHAGSSTVAQVTLSTSPSPGTAIFANSADATHIAAFDLVAVPEPSTIALGVLGIAGLVFVRRRK